MNLPLLLAGPILRRVEPTLVSVWVALRDPCDVRLKVWEGRAETSLPGQSSTGLEACRVWSSMESSRGAAPAAGLTRQF